MRPHEEHAGSHATASPDGGQRSVARGLTWFLVKLVVFGLLLAWPWPRLQQAYSRGFARATTWVVNACRWDNHGGLVNDRGEVMRGLFGSTGSAMFASEHDLPPAARRNLKQDIAIAVINFRHGLARDEHGNLRARGLSRNNRGPANVDDSRRTDSWMMGYLPTATFGALFLATPMPWRRRLWAGPLGLCLVQVFVLLRLALGIAVAFNGSAPYCLFELSPAWSRVLLAGFQILTTAPPMTYLVPLIIWAALCVRKDTILAITTTRASGS